MYRYQCSTCQKKFKKEQGAKAHIADHHKKKGGEVRLLPEVQPDHEESFADRSIDAHLDRAMGIYNPDSDWLI
jgi:hypothetical protein